ncbi:MAG: exopolysaccharide biosynthesis polyprenyl glycosylphosphotransferase [Desulforhopalus sp.]|jgi:exopolysaccharide biosynthesis polyprenyl glycosylphosphotransferase
MQKDPTNELGNTIFFADVLLTVVTFLAAFAGRNIFIEPTTPLHFSSHLFIIPLLLALVTSTLSYFGGYQSPFKTKLFGYCWSITQAIIVAVGILLVLLFFLRIQYVSRFVILLFASLELCVLVSFRAFVIAYYKKQVKSGAKMMRILVIGSRSRAQELVLALREHMVWGVEIVGFIDPEPSFVGTKVLGIPVIGTLDTIHDCLKENVVDEVVIAISRSLLKDAEPIVQACEEEGIRLRFMADIFNLQVARISLSNVKGIPLLNMEPVSQDPQQLFAKRVFDFTLTICSLPILIPFFMLVGMAIKLDSPGPAFFVQQRVGMRKHIFPMFKFRSMHMDAEERLKDLEHLNEADGPIFKLKDDPRVTRVGNFIRKTSIDELPQLINVLRGEMSLVGPRPMSQRDVGLFTRGIQRKRFSVQPGLTCIWQISGRSNLPFEKWLEFDLEYIDTWSFALDLKILLKTIPAVLKSKGAS